MKVLTRTKISNSNKILTRDLPSKVKNTEDVATSWYTIEEVDGKA